MDDKATLYSEDNPLDIALFDIYILRQIRLKGDVECCPEITGF